VPPELPVAIRLKDSSLSFFILSMKGFGQSVARNCMSIVAFMDLAKGLIFNRIKISLWICSIYSVIRVVCKNYGNRVGYKSIKKIDFAFS
jgi:hypothetical protein